MALTMDTVSHLSIPNGITSGTYNFPSIIHNGQATAVLGGFKSTFNDFNEHALNDLRVRIVNVKVGETSIEYQIDFKLVGDSQVGTCDVDVLVAAYLES